MIESTVYELKSYWNLKLTSTEISLERMCSNFSRHDFP